MPTFLTSTLSVQFVIACHFSFVTERAPDERARLTKETETGQWLLYKTCFPNFG